MNRRFFKENVRIHSYHQFYLVLAKIRIDQGLLYFTYFSWWRRHYASNISFSLHRERL